MNNMNINNLKSNDYLKLIAVRVIVMMTKLILIEKRVYMQLSYLFIKHVNQFLIMMIYKLQSRIYPNFRQLFSQCIFIQISKKFGDPYLNLKLSVGYLLFCIFCIIFYFIFLKDERENK